MTAKTYDNSDPKQVKSAKQLAKILRNREKNGIIKICNDPEIRYVLSQFFDATGVFRDTFSQVPTQHAFNDGQRNAGLWWLTKVLLHDPAIISKLQADDGSPILKGEQNDDDEHDDRSSNDGSD